MKKLILVLATTMILAACSTTVPAPTEADFDIAFNDAYDALNEGDQSRFLSHFSDECALSRFDGLAIFEVSQQIIEKFGPVDPSYMMVAFVTAVRAEVTYDIDEAPLIWIVEDGEWRRDLCAR